MAEYPLRWVPARRFPAYFSTFLVRNCAERIVGTIRKVYSIERVKLRLIEEIASKRIPSLSRFPRNESDDESVSR